MTNTPNSPVLRYLADIISRDDGKSFIELEFRTVHGALIRQLYERSLLANPATLTKRLLDDGIQPIDSQVVAAIISRPPIEVQEMTRRPGWHDDSFVYPDQTFGNATLRLIPSDIATGLGKRKGTVEAWREGARKVIRYSDLLLFAACLAPASSLLSMLHRNEGVLFHLHGTDRSSVSRKKNSTAGKTTAARFAISVTGSCKVTDLASWRFSQRGLEEHLVVHNHLVAAFDEEGAGSVTSSGHQLKRAELAYNIASGVGTKRASVAAKNGFPNESWCLFAISNGELPIDGAHVSRKEGDQVRMIALPVAPGGEGGIFNRLERFQDEIQAAGGLRAIIRDFERTIDENYGVAMPAFLAKIVPDREKLEKKIKNIIDEFVAEVCDQGSEPWDRRLAESFGVVYAAAILMARYKIGPWSKRRARGALTRLHNSARQALRSPCDLFDEAAKILREEIKGGRFPLIKKGVQAPDNLTSFARKRSGRMQLCIKISDLRQLLGKDCDEIIAHWRRREVVIPGSDGKLTRQLKLAGRKTRDRYVVIDRKKFNELKS